MLQFINCALIVSVLTMPAAAPLGLLGYSDAFTHLNIRMHSSHIHSATYAQRNMHTSIHTTATHSHIKRAYNHMKDENTDTI
jgi:hypothetical protein